MQQEALGLHNLCPESRLSHKDFDTSPAPSWSAGFSCCSLMPPRLRQPVQSLSLRGALPQPTLLACTQKAGEHVTDTPHNASASRQAPPPGQEAACTPQRTVSSDELASREVYACRSTKRAVGAARRRSPESAGKADPHDCFLPPSFLFEAKPGGRMHLKARQRLFALAAGASPVSAPSEAVTSGHADTPMAGPVHDTESAAPVPLMQHRLAAARRRQLGSTRGDLVHALSMHALLVHGTPAERAEVYRHRSGAEVGELDPLNRRLHRAELKAYLRFLVSHLPSLELQTLLTAFSEAYLHVMDIEQMEELLLLLHLGERAEEGGQQGPAASRSSRCCCCRREAQPAGPPTGLQQQQASGLPPDSQEDPSTSRGLKMQQLEGSSSRSTSSSSCSKSCCSCGSSLTSEALLRILRYLEAPSSKVKASGNCVHHF
ncbi:hypothetical protein Esti_003208 [Eimeria stiedai]